MELVKTTRRGLILVDYSQITNMAIRLRKELLTLRLDKFILLNKIKTRNLAFLFPNLYEAIKLEKESDYFNKGR